MKILVFSDSHASRGFMRHCIGAVKPDRVIHLGDYYEDGQVMAEENPGIPFYGVPGNCDRYRCPEGLCESMCLSIGGVMVFMTHGHRQQVKSGLSALVVEARKNKAQVALYGHTHIPDCRFEDGMWILNPGTCGSWGGTAGIIEIEDGAVTACRTISMEDTEATQ